MNGKTDKILCKEVNNVKQLSDRKPAKMDFVHSQLHNFHLPDKIIWQWLCRSTVIPVKVDFTANVYDAAGYTFRIQTI